MAWTNRVIYWADRGFAQFQLGCLWKPVTQHPEKRNCESRCRKVSLQHLIQTWSSGDRLLTSQRSAFPPQIHLRMYSLTSGDQNEEPAQTSLPWIPVD